MKKAMIICFGVLFVFSVIIGGCGGSEEMEVETPAAQTEAVQESAPVQEVVEQVQDEAAAVEEEVADTAEQATEEAASMADQAVDTAKEMGKEVMEDAGEKMAEELQQAMGDVEEKGSELMENPDVAAGVAKVEEVADEVEKTAQDAEAMH